MKKVLLTILGIILVAGVLAGAGFAGYRIGYNHGALAVSNGATRVVPWDKDFGSRNMPMHPNVPGFERSFGRGWDRGGYGMMPGMDMRFGFFSPLFFLVRVAVLVLIIWLAYKLIKNSGWQLSLKRQQADHPKAENNPNQD